MPRKINIPPDFHCVCGNPHCVIPFGCCHCGCGEKTPIADVGRKNGKQFAGYPLLFIRGHSGRKQGPYEKAIPFKIDGVYCRLIPLTQGYHTIVWESDYEWLARRKWFAWVNKQTGHIYACFGKYRKGRGPKLISMHKIILRPSDGMVTDHINGVTLDNRRDNLREATERQNTQNARRYKNNTTGFKGVSRDGNRFLATIRVDGKQIKLGRRKTAEEAYVLYKEAAFRQYGEFARIA